MNKKPKIIQVSRSEKIFSTHILFNLLLTYKLKEDIPNDENISDFPYIRAFE